MPHKNPNSQANLIPFRPGQCGNPNGRPKKRETIAQILERFGNLAIEKNKTILGLVAEDINPELLQTARTLKHLALLQQVLKASSGDLKAIEWIADRCEGKPNVFVTTAQVELQPLFEEEDKNAPFGFSGPIQLPDAVAEPVEPTPAPTLPEAPKSPSAPPVPLSQPEQASEVHEVPEAPKAEEKPRKKKKNPRYLG